MKLLTYNLIGENIIDNKSSNPFWIEFEDIDTIELRYVDKNGIIPVTYTINGSRFPFVIHVGQDQFYIKAKNNNITSAKLNGQNITLSKIPNNVCKITLKNGKIIQVDDSGNYWECDNYKLITNRGAYSIQDFYGNILMIRFTEEDLMYIKYDMKTSSPIDQHYLGLHTEYSIEAAA